MNILSYHVLNGITGKWLADDEHSWTQSFTDSAAFTKADLAQDIANRETKPHGVFYVMACMEG